MFDRKLHTVSTISNIFCFLHKYIFDNFQKSHVGNVYLTNSNLRTSGHYRCEISADAPTFQTVQSEQLLQVYSEYRKTLVVYVSNSQTMNSNNS